MNDTSGNAYLYTRRRFDHAEVAARYSKRHGGNARDRREQWCILEALRICRLPLGAEVLDLPCGAGRLAPALVAAGFNVTAADASMHMLVQARAAWNRHVAESGAACGQVRFDQVDIMDSHYPAGRFDVAICNRLLHHFNDAPTRVAAFAELSRIARQWVVVSFFNAATLDGMLFHLKARALRRRPQDRVPIMLSQLCADAAPAGLAFSSMIATRGPLSPQCYAIFKCGPKRLDGKA